MDIDDVTGAGVSIGKDKDGLAGEVWSLLRLNKSKPDIGRPFIDGGGNKDGVNPPVDGFGPFRNKDGGINTDEFDEFVFCDAFSRSRIMEAT